MNFLYIRVSTKEQKTDRQEVLKDTYKVDKVYIDKCSGKDTNRPQLKEMFKQLRKGDTVIVESYSRFSRSTKDLLNLVDKLNSLEVNFKSIKENLDTKTPQGRLMLTMFAGLYQFERECMLERQKEGIEIAKQKGNYKNVGRKKIEPNDKIFEMLYQQWKNNEIKSKDFMQALNLKSRTFYRRLKEYEENNNIKVENKKVRPGLIIYAKAIKKHAAYTNFETDKKCKKCNSSMRYCRNHSEEYKNDASSNGYICNNDNCVYIENIILDYREEV